MSKRGTFWAWGLTLVCAGLTLSFLWLVATDTRHGVNTLGQLTIACVLVLLHLAIAPFAIRIAWRQREHLIYAAIYGYFVVFFGTPIWLLFRGSGLYEDLHTQYYALVHPRDLKLHAALERQHLNPAEIEKILSEGARATARDAKGRSAIWKALYQNDVDTTRHLIAYGAEPDTRNEREDTPLCYVLAHDGDTANRPARLELIRLLMKAEADLSHPCEIGPPPLVVALQSSNLLTLRALLEGGARISSYQEIEATSRALYSAAGRGDDALLKALIELGEGVKGQRHLKEGALEAAIEKNEIRSALLLIDAGAIPSSKEILAMAIDRTKGDVNLVKALIGAGADLEAHNRYKKTPLHLSLQRRYLGAFQALLYGGADPNYTAGRHPHLLHLIFRLPKESRTDFAKPLLAAGANIEARDSDGRTVLMRAALAKDIAYARLAIESGAALNAKSRRGETAGDFALRAPVDGEMLALFGRTADPEPITGEQLVFVARHRSPGELQALLTAGVDVNERNQHQHTALEAAGRGKRIENFQVLLDAGADPNVDVGIGVAASCHSYRLRPGRTENADARYATREKSDC